MSQIILNKPYAYKPTLDRLQERWGPSGCFAAAEVIPFLMGVRGGMWADVEGDDSSSSSATSMSGDSDAEEEGGGCVNPKRKRDGGASAVRPPRTASNSNRGKTVGRQG